MQLLTIHDRHALYKDVNDFEGLCGSGVEPRLR